MEEYSPTHPISKLFQFISWIILSVYLVLVPLALSSITLGSVYDFPKWLLTVAVAVVLMLLWGVQTIITRKLVLPPRLVTISLTLIVAVTIISMLLSRSNLVNFLMGKAGFMIAFIMIVIFGSVLVGKRAVNLIPSLIIGAFLASTAQILSFFGILPKIITDPVVSAKIFTPLGSQLTLLTFLGIILPTIIYLAFSSKEAMKKVLLFVVSGVTTLALILALAQVLPNQPAAPTLMPFSSGWSLAVDQLKTGKTALFGVGPDRFAITYAKLRSAALNSGDLWQVRYPSSTNEWLTILTTLGLTGLAMLVLAIVVFSKTLLKRRAETNFAALGMSWIALLIFLTILPASFASLMLMFVLMLILAGQESKNFVVFESELNIITGIPAVILALAMFYFTGRAAFAEAVFGDSLRKGTEGKYIEMYNQQIQALKYNPYIVRYRLSYSNTNFAIANGLAAQENLTDDDREKITNLISQSIREAKAAVALDSENANSWVNLANIYRQLINFAQGADQWAIASYIQAIRLDNTNPQLRIELGGLLFSLRRYEEAIDQFKQAIVLKPDYANAYYNLSNAYKATNQPIQSYAAMQNVLQLIDPNSADYEKALTELNELQKLLPQTAQQATAAAAARQSELTVPSPLPSPVAEPVEFDQQEQKELAPEVAPTTNPEPTAVPTQEPAPEASESANQ